MVIVRDVEKHIVTIRHVGRAGRTWQAAAVQGRTLRVTNSPSGFVSLRVNAVDTAGNTATVTAIRAYAIGWPRGGRVCRARPAPGTQSQKKIQIF